VKRKNDDSDKVICQVNQSLFLITTWLFVNPFFIVKLT
jgi:hypothetical protein